VRRGALTALLLAGALAGGAASSEAALPGGSVDASASGSARAGASKARACSGRRARPLRRARCSRMRRMARERAAAERIAPFAGGPVAPGGGGGSDGGGSGGGGGGSAPGLGRFVSVAAREWSLTLSRPVVARGSVTVELRNVGEDPHNLVVSLDDGSHAPISTWAETDPGALLRQTVTLDAGQYLLWCSLEGHEADGMSARLRVE
jgi:hypothetical protein